MYYYLSCEIEVCYNDETFFYYPVITGRLNTILEDDFETENEAVSEAMAWIDSQDLQQSSGAVTS